MAVDGVHDSNIYLSAKVEEFTLHGVQTTPVMNGGLYEFNENSLTFHQGTQDEITAVPANRWGVWYSILGPPGTTTWKYFEKSGNTWNFIIGSYDPETQENFNENTYVVTTTQGHIDNPYFLDLSDLTSSDAAFGGFFYGSRHSLLKLNSVQNISFSHNVNEYPISTLGNQCAGTTIGGPTTVTASIDKFLLNRDQVRNLARDGITYITGQFEYGDNILQFYGGVINGYSVAASVGELPQISFDLEIYEGLHALGSPLNLPDDEDAPEEIGQDGLIVTFDKGGTNSVQSFNFTETFNVQPIYGLGQDTPSHISIVGPINQEVTISMEVEDYESEDTFSFLDSAKDRNRTIQLQISGSSVLNTFALENAYLVDESITAGVGDTIIANLTYRGYKKV